VLKFFINIVNNSFSKFSKDVKTPGMEQKMFIKSKLLTWSAKSRKTPGMECKVRSNKLLAWSAKFDIQISTAMTKLSPICKLT
jgi:hypothetical protein